MNLLPVIQIRNLGGEGNGREHWLIIRPILNRLRVAVKTAFSMFIFTLVYTPFTHALYTRVLASIMHGSGTGVKCTGITEERPGRSGLRDLSPKLSSHPIPMRISP
jgi:hypothetical protein